MNTTKYRVDRTDNLTVPCGMNSIRHLSGNLAQAEKYFRSLPVGLDAWDRPACGFGLVLSSWYDGEYHILASRGIGEVEK